MAAIMHRTAGTPTNINKCTWSLWLKRGQLTTTAGECFFGTETAPGYIQYRFGPTATTNQIRMEAGGVDGGGFEYLTNRLFRDTNAWYHIVIAQDSTQAVAGDRVKLYINGVQETSFATQTNWQLNSGIPYNASGAVQTIGSYGATSNLFSGCMSHFHFIDGTQYAASDFGSFDATSGIWKINTGPSVTYGNNGFFLKMEDRTNLDLDSSPNAHTFTTTGDITATYDNPSNNFCTLNPLTKDAGGAKTYTHGNNTVTETANSWTSAHSTLEASTGKYYCETKLISFSGGTQSYVGAASGDEIASKSASTYNIGSGNGSVGYYSTNGKIEKGGADTAGWGDSWTTGDIIGTALDLDNNFIYFSKNGTWQDSGDPTSGATGTGGVALPSGMTGGELIGFSVSPNESVLSVNFGNGYFGITAVASTNADDAGIGSFEYDVPSGFYALCTKNIKAYG